MGTPLSAGRCLFLLMLGVMMLSSNAAKMRDFRCCYGGIEKPEGEVFKCFKQVSRHDCKHNAYKVKLMSGNVSCINQHSQWIQEKMKEGLKCRPEFSDKRIVKVLQMRNYDLEEKK